MSEPRPRKPALRRAAVAAVLVAALLLLAWQVRKVGAGALLARFAGAHPGWLAAAAGITVLRFVASALRLGWLTGRLRPVRKRHYFPIVMAAQFLALAIPGVRAGASLVRAHLADRHFGGGVATHVGPNIVDQAILALSWILVSAVALPFAALAHAGNLSGKAVAGLILGLGLIVLAYLLVRRHGERLEAWLARPREGRRGRLAEAGQAAVRGTGVLLDDPVGLLGNLAGGLAFVLLTGLAQWAALRAVGAPVPWWIALLAVAVGGATGMATGAPGGIGVTEVTQAAFLHSQGVPREVAIAGVFLARGLHYLVILAAGGLSLAWEAARGTGILPLGTPAADAPGDDPGGQDGGR